MATLLWLAAIARFLNFNTACYADKMSLSRFIALWTHPNHATDRVSEHELEGAERSLQTRHIQGFPLTISRDQIRLELVGHAASLLKQRMSAML